MKHMYTCPCLNQSFDIEVIFPMNISSDRQNESLLMLDAFLNEKLCSDKTDSATKAAWQAAIQGNTPFTIKVDYSYVPPVGLVGPIGKNALVTLPKK